MTQVTVGTSPVKISNAGNRDFINIYNNGGATIFLCYDGTCDSAVDPTGAALTVNNGWPITSGAYFTISNDGNRNVWNHEIWAVSGSAGQDVRLQG